MAIARTRGNTSLRERPDSPEWDIGTQKTTCTRTYEGMYADVLRKAPLIGAAMADLGNPGLLVESIKIKKSISGKATMTVILEVEIAPQTTFPEPVQPVYEVEWIALEKPLEASPTFHDPDSPLKLDATDLYNIAEWEASSDPTTRKMKYDGMSNAAKSCADKKLRGTTTVILPSPIVRITTLTRNVYVASEDDTSASDGASSGVGTLYNVIPGFDEAPTGYVWLKMADRSTRTGRTGKWQRVEEWQGSAFWDTELYGQPTGTPPDDGSGSDSGSGGSGS